MATSRTNNQGSSAAQTEKQTRRQDLNAEQQKDLVRAISLQELNQLWRFMEKNQDISYSYAEEEELDSLEAMDEEEISEISMADEDALDEFDGEELDDDDNPNAFFLDVTIDEKGKAHCSAPDLSTYLSATPKTPLGQNCLYELSKRGETLRKLAKWLEDNRQNFLKSRKIADLGENAWEECRNEKLPIYQEKLAKVLDVSGSTFGKNIKNVMLKWEGVMVSMEILFSKEARMAWAKSVYKSQPDISDKDLDLLAKITGVDAETIKAKAR